jgi:hypothetical protein
MKALSIILLVCLLLFAASVVADSGDACIEPTPRPTLILDCFIYLPMVGRVAPTPRPTLEVE